jgi:3-hydroxyisobutyrate dehydrogenase-like beta-hydroxyacid dehydrogenase
MGKETYESQIGERRDRGDDMRPEVGFVGVGNIGAPICRHLIDGGYPVAVFDADPRALEEFRGTAATIASSLTDLARRSEVVVLSLPDSDVVERVVLGEEGLLADGLSGGKVLIDTSSSRPSSTRRIAAHLAEKGIDMLDAPVSGGVLRAREGSLAVMVGGEEEVYERHRELLGSFGSQIFYVGGHGAGHMTKCLNNLASATTLAASAEIVLLGVRAGLEPEKLVEVINASSGRSYSTEVKFPRYVLNRAFDDGFAIHLMSKDVKIALDTAAELRGPMLIGSAVGRVWEEAVSQGYGSESHTAIYAFIEKMMEQTGPEQESID